MSFKKNTKIMLGIKTALLDINIFGVNIIIEAVICTLKMYSFVFDCYMGSAF